jgi:hypothetical protein
MSCGAHGRNSNEKRSIEEMGEGLKLSLENLGSGAAVELFDVELQRVLDNIVD